jgi:secondary thiamine-phosphate synthase enzyme
MLETIQVHTPDHSVMVDVTDLIGQKVRENGVKSGICLVYVPHTTAGIMVNEGADPAVMEDVLTSLDRMVPWRAGYKHTEGNAAAHIKAILVGGSTHLIIDSGRLMLGTWERIFLCEFDGPRTRKIRMKIMDDHETGQVMSDE